ncbi:hypothetical protein [Burkholderia gladioli]|uniref:hypothetical protein n=1 Tax=Burkholderia gladioli TaxID=28095 RepID=UPI001640A165|nr:hypothetical protein [Burkholderia gladioli]
MSTNSEELMVCAESMAKIANNDAEFRAVCSRAYYAAFIGAREFHAALATPGSVGNANGTHQQLIAQLLAPGISAKNKKHATSKALGKSLIPLLKTRVDADYKIGLDFDKVTADTTVANSRTTVDASK